MASTTLPNGIIVPEKFSRDWYADLYHNWQELDNLLGGGTPKDGTLTIQKNGDTVGTFSANQATDETISITVPDVNDGTLTIQQNGTTVDTFTANSSSDKTVNIQCVDLENNQTVAGDKEFTGTTTAHDLVPSATDTYNFGSSTNKWKSFNGINPGALSLPSVNADAVTVDTTNFAWNASWSYTPVFDGWITVWIPASAATKRRFAISHGYLRYWYEKQNGGIFRFSFPVVKNISVFFAFTSDIEEPAAPNIYLLKSQGNV